MGIQSIVDAEFVRAFQPREMAAKDIKHDTQEVLKVAATRRVLAAAVRKEVGHTIRKRSLVLALKPSSAVHRVGVSDGDAQDGGLEVGCRTGKGDVPS